MYQRVIVVVEDDVLVRSLLSETLEHAGFRVVSAGNASDAKRVIASVDPDAVVLDIDLGRGPNGFDIAKKLRSDSQGVGIVYLTSLPDPRFGGQDLEFVDKREAYLSKSLITEPKILIEAIESVLHEENTEKFQHHKMTGRPFQNLSRTQIEILQLIAEGKTNQRIADMRGRSLGATEGTISRTLEALGIESNLNLNSRVLAVRKYFAVLKPND